MQNQPAEAFMLASVIQGTPTSWWERKNEHSHQQLSNYFALIWAKFWEKLNPNKYYNVELVWKQGLLCYISLFFLRLRGTQMFVQFCRTNPYKRSPFFISSFFSSILRKDLCYIPTYYFQGRTWLLIEIRCHRICPCPSLELSKLTELKTN